MSGSADPECVPETPALSHDVLCIVLAFLDISLRERCQLQLVCRSFRDALNDSPGSAVWGSCSLERDFPDNITFNDLNRWVLKPGRIFRHADNQRTVAFRSSRARTTRFQKTITVLVPELAERLERTGGTMHLQLAADTISSMLCHGLHGQQRDMSGLWTSASGCLTRLTIEVPVEHLSACCISMAPLTKLQQLELSCNPAPIPYETSKLPVQRIATSLPQLECLSISHVACDVALQLYGPKLQSLRLFDMPQTVGLDVSAPRLKDFALRDVQMQPAHSHNGADRLTSLVSSMSGLTSLELLQTSRGYRDDVGKLIHLSKLTRLVTTRMRPTAVPSLPISLRRLIVTGTDISIQDDADTPASMWHLEALHKIAPDPEGELFSPDQDVPWGMGSLAEWHPRFHSDRHHPSNNEWVLQLYKKPNADRPLPIEYYTSLMFLYRRHE